MQQLSSTMRSCRTTSLCCAGPLAPPRQPTALAHLVLDMPAACRSHCVHHKGNYMQLQVLHVNLSRSVAVSLQPQLQQGNSSATTDISSSTSNSSISSAGAPNTAQVSRVLHQQQQWQQQQRYQSLGSQLADSRSDIAVDQDTAAAVMVDFLSAYGLQHGDIQRLLQECPQLFQDSSSSSNSTAFGSAGSCTAGWSPYSYEEEAAAQEAAAAAAAVGNVSAAGAVAEVPCTSVYEVGRTLLFFHSLGWSHSSVMRRIIGLYPQLLTKQVDRDIVPVLEALTAMGCSESDVQLLVWEFPRIFCSSNWRRHIRKFQYLGLYGLPPPGQNSISCSSSTDSLERLMRWF